MPSRSISACIARGASDGGLFRIDRPCLQSCRQGAHPCWPLTARPVALCGWRSVIRLGARQAGAWRRMRGDDTIASPSFAFGDRKEMAER